MSSKFRIPTLLGLSLVAAGLMTGVFLTSQKQFLGWQTKAGSSTIPKEAVVVNITATSASIFWKTDTPSLGSVQAGPTTLLGSTFLDNRDIETPQNRELHFVTLKNLTPNTTYHYKINSGSTVFPQGTPLSFKTTSFQASTNRPPLIGTVLDHTSQPIKEALVTLEIPGAQPLATITKLAGNFVLPLTEVQSSDPNRELTNSFDGIKATLNVSDHQQRSQVTFYFPLENSLLPPVTLGKDLDLSTKTVSPTPSNLKFDLNKDGVVNSLDLSLVQKNFGKNPKDKTADFNQDGIVDKKDLEIISKSLYPTPSPG